jgi:Domain of unknown function (DUF4157)
VVFSPKPIFPGRAGTGLPSDTAQRKSRSDGMPQPILPARPGARPAVGQPQGMPQPIRPAPMSAGTAGRSGVIQGAFPGGRPRVPVRAPRPGQGPKGSVQLKPAAAPGNATPLPDDFARVRSFAPGKRMPPTIQAKMESLFGARFGDVRIHEGPEASSIGALAFTQGSSIFFAPGQYNPNTPQGQRLLGQQLAHVVQQRSGRVRNPFGAGTAVVQDPLLKAEAEMMGARAATAHSQSVQPKGLNGQQPASNPRHQAPAPILPKKPGAASGSILRSTSAPAPILPGRANAGVSGTLSTWPKSATSNGGPILPGKPVQAMLAPAPILPGRSFALSGAVGRAVQPLMALGAAVALGRELITSVVTQVGRRVFGL